MEPLLKPVYLKTKSELENYDILSSHIKPLADIFADIHPKSNK